MTTLGILLCAFVVLVGLVIFGFLRDRQTQTRIAVLKSVANQLGFDFDSKGFICNRRLGLSNEQEDNLPEFAKALPIFKPNIWSLAPMISSIDRNGVTWTLCDMTIDRGYGSGQDKFSLVMASKVGLNLMPNTTSSPVTMPNYHWEISGPYVLVKAVGLVSAEEFLELKKFVQDFLDQVPSAIFTS